MGKTIIKPVIDGTDLLKWFYLGAQEVQLNKKYLNSINIFPVADGDTGTNLSMTMKAMVERPKKENTFNKMLQGISESGLAHARGNSGILFASYINGLSVEGKIFDVVTIKDFANIANQAVKYLYQAIENPLEGTMISVIRDWASFLFQNHEKYNNFQEFMYDAYQTANISLQRTTTQLDILKRNHMVDSGAEGFVRFLNGINRYFKDGDVEVSEPWENELVFTKDDNSGQFEFCTEVYMGLNQQACSLSPLELDEKIKAQLSGLGDCLIVSPGNGKVRVHIHTDSPEVVIDIMKEHGSFIEQKVDNMKLQQSVKANQISKIGILTDSIADLPEDFKVTNQIHTLPLGLLIGDSVYLDKLTIKLKQLFQNLRQANTYPTSSQPEPTRVSNFIENLLDTYDSLIFITVSGKLSGTYQMITQEVKKLDLKNKKVSIIDSRLNSGAQGLLVKAAIDLRKEGYTHEEIVKEIEARIPKTNIYVCLNTLEFAIRSGRVPNTIGKIGMRLGMRPIMTLDKDGNGAAFGVGFSKKGISKQIFGLVKKNLKHSGIKAYSIVHADNIELATEYKNILTKIIGKEPEFISEISSIVAIHSGLGCVAVAITKE